MACWWCAVQVDVIIIIFCDIILLFQSCEFADVVQPLKRHAPKLKFNKLCFLPFRYTITKVVTICPPPIKTYNVRKILSPSSSLLLLAKTVTHPAARSLCDSWASCIRLSNAFHWWVTHYRLAPNKGSRQIRPSSCYTNSANLFHASLVNESTACNRS